MRTVEIKAELVVKALARSSACTTRAAVAEAMRAQIRIRRQVGIRRLRGKVKWEGDLSAMRGATPASGSDAND